MVVNDDDVCALTHRPPRYHRWYSERHTGNMVGRGKTLPITKVPALPSHGLVVVNLQRACVMGGVMFYMPG